MRAYFVMATAVAALLAFGACGTTSGAGTGGGASTDGGGLTTFVATDIHGGDFDLADHVGKDVILMSFWATYCEPCKTEMPVLQRLHDEYGPQGLKILSVSLDDHDTMAGVRPYISTQGYTFTVVIDEDTSIAQAYNSRTAAPFTVLIDRAGHIHKTMEGFQLSEAPALEAEVKELIAHR